MLVPGLAVTQHVVDGPALAQDVAVGNANHHLTHLHPDAAAMTNPHQGIATGTSSSSSPGKARKSTNSSSPKKHQKKYGAGGRERPEEVVLDDNSVVPDLDVAVEGKTPVSFE